MSVHSLFWIADGLFSVDPLIEIQRALGTGWEPVVRAITLLGDSRLILVLGIALFWYVARHRPYQVLAASLLGAGLGSLIKLLVDLPRPADPQLLLVSASTSPSFPSGHVMIATCFWGTLAWYGWIPRWVAAAIVALVMFSRVYLGAHFLGDVLFGALIGIAWLAIFHRYLGPWLQGFRPKSLTRVVALVMAGSFAVLPVTSAFPFGWEIVGGIIGASAGLILQERYVRFEPGPVANLWQLAKFQVGIAGVVLIIGVDRLIGPEIMAVELAMYFLAALWGLLLAPMIFKRFGLSRPPATEPALSRPV
jgi:membrane-associated phospholipid phosphatase